jgi:hypothetical protein
MPSAKPQRQRGWRSERATASSHHVLLGEQKLCACSPHDHKMWTVNSTGQRDTIDDFGGGVAWSRLGVRVCRRIGGRRYGIGGRRGTRS